ncbi:phytanoyl- dioxygenase family protein [Colletotrichum graminicola]|nr:phytanoyl- dioxygenase family protein [Colletotrichum graminicola]
MRSFCVCLPISQTSHAQIAGMETSNVRDSRLLVRLYSVEAEERNPPGSEAHALAQVLTEGQENRNAAIDPWRRFFEPQDQSEDINGLVNTVLDVETAALRKKWVVFRDSCSDAERLDLSMSQPTMKGVVDTVQAIQKTWEFQRQNGRLNKAKRFFHNFCGTLNSHKLMMTVLPSGNEYVSIFTGALNVIIHASANHEKIVEGLSGALCTIGEYVGDCAIDQELFRTEDMQKLIVDLYSHIFLFLTTVMDWMMKKRRRRLLDSFNEDLPTVFEYDMEKIRTITNRIRSRAEQNSRAEARSARLTLEDLARDVRVGLEGERRHQAEMIHHAEGIRRDQQRSLNSWSFEKRQQLANSIVDLLEGKALGWLERARGMHDLSRQPHVNPTVAFSLVQPSIKGLGMIN